MENVELISTTEPLKVGFLGPVYTFSHKAAMEVFGIGKGNVDYIPYEKFDLLLTAVKIDEINKGIIPFFNFYKEHIRECQEMLYDSDLIATNVVKIEINLCLASNAAKIEDIKRVYSIEHVFKQCDIWVLKNLPNIKRIKTDSTAKAAGSVQRKLETAAICSFEAAGPNGLKVLAREIQNPKNFTLFFVVQPRESVKKWGKYSSFCFKLTDRAQKMHILDMLERHNLESTQQWDFSHPENGHILCFIEFFSRYTDLNVIGFESECRKHYPACKLVGSMDASIANIVGQI
ncbi:MAG: hypothetical protein KAV87_61935 [Desulfobacteraceae bacterium]|nr:hypothetical protein [Desulfobacteraceae bacterium]